MTRGNVLATVVRASGPMLTRFMAGFDDATRTRQAQNLPNHVAWTLGHCAYTMGRLVERFGGPPLPETDFVAGDGSRADPDRYDTQTVRLGSTPVDDPGLYPALHRCLAIFESAVERLATAVQSADDALLDKPVSWGSHEHPLGALAVRVSLHNTQHGGQLADLRRALGMPRIAG